MMTSRRTNGVAALRFSLPAVMGVYLLTIGYGKCVNANDQANSSLPKVSITAPKDDSTYSWKTLVNYSIVVSYQGKSTQYQEIPSKQVLLTATYVPDLSTVAGKPATAIGPTPGGLLDIIRSNCLGCHEFNAKAMGPSFAAIARRYPQSQTTVDALSGHIRNGSEALWGQENMPPHQDLTEDQARAIALWIMKNAATPNVHYYVGTEGAIRMNAPGTPGPKAGMMLTASYTSPTPAAGAQQAPHGEDVVIVRGK